MGPVSVLLVLVGVGALPFDGPVWIGCLVLAPVLVGFATYAGVRSAAHRCWVSVESGTLTVANFGVVQPRINASPNHTAIENGFSTGTWDFECLVAVNYEGGSRTELRILALGIEDSTVLEHMLGIDD